MDSRKDYTGIDFFRLAAAFLILAIHTSPLSSYTETGDFILTRILARVAVPFYFMTSGFFLISRYAHQRERLKLFLKKIALLYGCAIVLYLPLNIYNEYFLMEYLLPNIIKDIFFDGTLYHLWYLPAAIIGAGIAWFLVRKAGFQRAFILTLLLYMAGMLGDSYYGAIRQMEGLKSLYNAMFEVFDYTRNGLFFAPVFFVMGGMIAEKPMKVSFKYFGVFLLLMLGEGMLIHHLDWQRHDSMYIFLIPCMYFLFRWLIIFRGQRREGWRALSLLIYLLHPMMIVVVRMVARILDLQALLIQNSLIHYLAVSILSVAGSLLCLFVIQRMGIHGKKPVWEEKSSDYGQVYTQVKIQRGKPMREEKSRAWIELNLEHLSHNVKTLCQVLPEGCELMAVVKAQAYGHGLYEITVNLNRMGVKAFAVATVDEGIALRSWGTIGEILILGYTAPERARELCQYQLTQTLIDKEYAVGLNGQGYRVQVHLKVDTGMHRLGFCVENTEEIANVFTMKHLKVSGIFTHLCTADSLDSTSQRFTREQIYCFHRLLTQLQEKGIALPKVHVQSSYGFLNYPELKYDYVRVGISLYGVASFPHESTRQGLELKPVLSLKARIILLRTIAKGEGVGYGRAFVAKRDSVIAILPIGYADGFPGSLSCGRSQVLIQGRRVPVVGKVCMDQLAVDVTELPNVKVGMVATLIGKDGEEEILASTVAEQAGSITNEFLCRMGRRLKCYCSCKLPMV